MVNKTVTLQKIIDEVLEEKGIKGTDGYEAASKNLHRLFDRFLRGLGVDKETLKGENKRFSFNEAEVFCTKIALRKLYENDGIVADIANECADEEMLSYEKIRQLALEFINEANREGWDKEEQEILKDVLSDTFSLKASHFIWASHKMIDMLAGEASGLLANKKEESLRKIYIFIAKELINTIVELPIETVEVADMLEYTKELYGNELGYQDYSGNEKSIQLEYQSRDKRLLKAIQEDEGLRKYVEEKIGKKAEEIFSYAAKNI